MASITQIVMKFRCKKKQALSVRMSTKIPNLFEIKALKERIIKNTNY